MRKTNKNLEIFIEEITYQKCNQWAYAMKLEDCDEFGTYWVACYVENNKGTYFDGDIVKNIPKKVNIIGDKNMKANIFKIQAYDQMHLIKSIHIWLIDFMFDNNGFLNCASLLCLLRLEKFLKK